MQRLLLLLLLVPMLARAEDSSDGVFAPLDPDELRVEASALGTVAPVLGCDSTNDPASIPRDGLPEQARAELDVHQSTDRVLVDATLDGQRHVFHILGETTIQWSFNPDRIRLMVPGESEARVFLIDGKARYCPETRVLALNGRAPEAASLSVQATPATQEVAVGASAVLQIRLINSGTETLGPVNVTSSPISTCARTVASLGAGFSYTYTCTRTNVQSNIENIVIATGSYAGGSVSATALSIITIPGVVKPPASSSWTLQRMPWSQYAKPGETAYWRITVSNPTTQPISDVRVRDALVPACDTTIPVVQPSQTIEYGCSFTVPGGAALRLFTTTSTRAATSSNPHTEGWTLTNGIVTDHIHVDGMDGCVTTGPSVDFCGLSSPWPVADGPVHRFRPVLRRPAR